MPLQSQQSALVTVALSWTAPTQNLDGTVLTDLAGYRIYWGASIDTLTNVIEVAGKDTVQHTIPDFAFGDWVFVVAAVDTTGNISPPSQGVNLNVTLPGTPGNVACSGTYALMANMSATVQCVPLP